MIFSGKLGRRVFVITQKRLNGLVDVEHQFRNRDVKLFLLRHFGSNIDFTYPDDVCKCLMVYSVSCNRPDVLAERIRSTDPIEVCATQLCHERSDDGGYQK